MKNNDCEVGMWGKDCEGILGGQSKWNGSVEWINWRERDCRKKENWSFCCGQDLARSFHEGLVHQRCRWHTFCKIQKWVFSFLPPQQHIPKHQHQGTRRAVSTIFQSQHSIQTYKGSPKEVQDKGGWGEGERRFSEAGHTHSLQQQIQPQTEGSVHPSQHCTEEDQWHPRSPYEWLQVSNRDLIL